jgi:hypothetical protein
VKARSVNERIFPTFHFSFIERRKDSESMHDARAKLSAVEGTALPAIVIRLSVASETPPSAEIGSSIRKCQRRALSRENESSRE